MKKIRKIFIYLLFVISITITTSCVTTRIANLQKATDKDIEIFITNYPTKEYFEIKYIQADGAIFHTPEILLKNLKEKAIEVGADAIIDIYYGYQFWWPYASCVAIKYK